jgi:GntR family transcriptional regulator, rspAB operon transcriptional repressor
LSVVAAVASTKEQRAYEKILDLIVHARLPENEFLSQRKLAAKVDATVPNVRAALRRLEKDGLIENVPQWGVRIPVEDADGLRDRYFVRETIEVAAVRRIVSRRPIPEAETILETARDADRISSNPDSDIAEYTPVHSELHAMIVRAAGSPKLFSLYRRAQLRSCMIWNAQRGWLRGLDRSPDHHLSLVRCILEGDEELAVASMITHIENGLGNELEVIEGSAVGREGTG